MAFLCLCVVLCSVGSQREDGPSVARQVLPQEVDDSFVHHYGPSPQGSVDTAKECKNPAVKLLHNKPNIVVIFVLCRFCSSANPLTSCIRFVTTERHRAKSHQRPKPQTLPKMVNTSLCLT